MARHATHLSGIVSVGYPVQHVIASKRINVRKVGSPRVGRLAGAPSPHVINRPLLELVPPNIRLDDWILNSLLLTEALF